MSKVYEVKSCTNCPSHKKVEGYNGFCLADIDMRGIRDIKVIPQWCPLPDTPTTTTEAKA